MGRVTQNTLIVNSLWKKIEIEEKPLSEKQILAVMNPALLKSLKENESDSTEISTRAPRGKVWLDGLKLCFTDRPGCFDGDEWQPNRLFKALAEGERQKFWGEAGEFFTFRVFREDGVQDEDEDEDEDANALAPKDSAADKVSVRIHVPRVEENGETGFSVLGTLTVNRTRRDPETGELVPGKAFLTLSNFSFYNGDLFNLYYVLDSLGLEFNNFTQITVAWTGERDMIGRFNALRRNTALDMILNRKKLTPEEKLNGACLCYGFSRVKNDSQPTVYLSSANEDIKIRMYNKKRELLEASPHKAEAVKKWYGHNFRTLQRVEAEIKNTEVRKIVEVMREKYNGDYVHDDRLLGYLFSERFLRQLLHEAIEKVVYWRCGDTKITFI